MTGSLPRSSIRFGNGKSLSMSGEQEPMRKGRVGWICLPQPSGLSALFLLVIHLPFALRYRRASDWNH